MTAAVFDFILEERSQSFLGTIASAVVAALVAAPLFYRMLWYERQRRKAILLRLEISDMNHHIRNAVQPLVLFAQFPPNEVSVKDIQESVQRVDWALKEILESTSRKDRQRRRPNRHRLPT